MPTDRNHDEMFITIGLLLTIIVLLGAISYEDNRIRELETKVQQLQLHCIPAKLTWR
jgi:hypothetical protein